MSGSKKKNVVRVVVIGAAGIAILIGIGAARGFNMLPFSSNVSGNTGPSEQADTSNPEPKPLVPLDQIVSGGPPKDGIPSIDNPKFVSVMDADKFLKDSELVLGLNINGDVRAYPLQILVWHEIVNDKVGGVPVAVTYCPLCFTNQVFKRAIEEANGQIALEFGTSGKLYNSNLVMYDRTSQSYWSQALGQAIAGKYTGTILGKIPFDLATWKDWKQAYPESKVLSQETGFSRPYGADPYGGYYTSPQVLFPLSHHDNRLDVKEIVVGLENNGTYKAYTLKQIEVDKIINDEINDKSFALFSAHPFMVRAYDRVVDGRTLEFGYSSTNSTFVDRQTKSLWNFDGLAVDGPMKGKQLIGLPFDEGFWFEWATFHPKTEIYGK
jgi:hypothetical protein